MSKTPLVSIIVPSIHGDGRIANALRACTSQTLGNIEIICVDASPDGGFVEQTASTDPRVRVVRLPAGTSLSTACRAGTYAARGSYMMFVDVDDVLRGDAVANAYKSAIESDADIVALATTGAQGSDRSQPAPRRSTLRDGNIVRQLFPDGETATVGLRHHLFRAALLRSAYADFPDAATVAAADEFAVMFLACAGSTTYATLRTPSYQRSINQNQVSDKASSFSSALAAIRSLASLEPVVRELARHSSNPEPLADGFETLKLSQIADAYSSLQRIPADEHAFRLAQLHACASDTDLVTALATFAPTALTRLAQNSERLELGDKPVRSILLTTNILTTGGVSGVLLSQARVLLDAGLRVTIATHRSGSDVALVPVGAGFVELSGPTKRDRTARWAEICRANEVDVVIDHRILYSRDWHHYALVARTSNAATIGWIHNFAGRPTYNGNELLTLIRDNANALAQLIVLSPLDVAFWKLRGVSHVAYLPNPPSPLLLDSVERLPVKRAPHARRLEVVWWGRLEEHTKKVTELIEVAVALKRIGTDFRLRVVGPDWTDMTAQRLSAFAEKRGVADFVEVTGPRHGEALLNVIDSSDVFISTSIIEGYLLTIPEAQSRGLPVVMYDLPWLLPVQDNAGVISVPQGDADALASAVTAVALDPVRYERLSTASVDAAVRATSYDFTQLYLQLVSGSLPDNLSPAPTLDDGRKILDLLVFFAENSSAPITAARADKPGARPRRRNRPQTPGARLEQKLTPAGHNLLDAAPWLRPVARRVKQTLLRQ